MISVTICPHAVDLTLRRCALCDSVDQMTINDLRARVAAAEAERDAYKRAKAENDERFMIERDEARKQRDAAEAALGDCIEDFAYAIQYKDEHLRKKHNDDERVAQYRAVLGARR